jgi:hypothetical protein
MVSQVVVVYENSKGPAVKFVLNKCNLCQYVNCSSHTFEEFKTVSEIVEQQFILDTLCTWSSG